MTIVDLGACRRQVFAVFVTCWGCRGKLRGHMCGRCLERFGEVSEMLLEARLRLKIDFALYLKDLLKTIKHMVVTESCVLP